MGDRVVHFEIGCEDLKAASQFYEKVFGWELTDYGPNGKRIETGAEGGINGHLTQLAERPNYLNIYIEVSDLEGKLASVVEAGGKTLIGPLPTPDGRRFVWVKDVTGNTIGLLEQA